MAKLTIAFGVLLGVLGVAAYMGAGSVHRSALLPAVVGVVLLLCGLLANTEDRGRRMLWMHVAVTFGLVGFIAGAVLLWLQFKWAAGQPFDDPMVPGEWGAMSLLCLIFVGLCVRSFIAARRERVVAR